MNLTRAVVFALVKSAPFYDCAPRNALKYMSRVEVFSTVKHAQFNRLPLNNSLDYLEFALAQSV
jgi:hypothetical protein